MGTLFSAAVLVLPIVAVHIGLFVYLADRRALINRLVLLVSAAVAAWNLHLAVEHLGLPHPWLDVCLAGGYFLPATFLHLAVEYTSSRSPFLSRFLLASYLAAGILFFAAPISAESPAFVGYFLAVNGTSAYLLWRRICSTRGSLRHQTVLIATGAAAAILSALPGQLLPGSMWGHPFNSLGGAVYLATLAYAVVHYRFSNFSLLLRKSAVYSLAIATIVGLYVFLVMVLGRWAAALWGVSPLTFAFFATLMAGPAFYPLQQGLERAFRKLMPLPQDDYYQGLMVFSQEINYLAPLPQLTDFVARRIMSLLRLAGACLLVIPERADALLRVATAGPTGLQSTLTTLPGPPPAGVRALSEASGLPLAAILPLESRGRKVAVLGLCNHLNGEELSPEDWEVVSALGRQASIALDNAELYSELVAVKNHYVSVIESSANAVLVADRNLVITDLNETAAGCFGPRKDLLNVSFRAFPPFEALVEMAESVLSEGVAVTGREVTLSTQRGTCPFLANISPLKGDASGRDPTGVVLILADLSGIRAMERQVDRAQRLAALGRLSAGLAHEIRNGLNKIGGYAAMLEDALPPDSPFARFPKGISEDVSSLEGMLSRFLTFARLESCREEKVLITGLLDRILDALSTELRAKQVRVERDYGPGLEPVQGDPTRLEQAFTNLVLNAIEAMERGGVLSLQVSSGGRGIMVRIADNGCGISPELLDKVFDPFFTTKPCGTGLGLAITHRIVSQHGGEITLSSEPGKGTEVTLTFPATHDRLSPESEEDADARRCS
ncbi:MAG: ATP-binding protein [Bacillota bacterium]|nr:ATP-binding protein [Bacillota bacterium]